MSELYRCVKEHVLKLGQTPCGGISSSFTSLSLFLSLWLLLFAQPTIKTVNQSRARILQWTIYLLLPWGRYLWLGTACRHIVLRRKANLPNIKRARRFIKVTACRLKGQPWVSLILTAERRRLQKLMWSFNENTVIVNKRWADLCLFMMSLHLHYLLHHSTEYLILIDRGLHPVVKYFSVLKQ